MQRIEHRLKRVCPTTDRLRDILELDYIDFKIPLFKCKWADKTRGVKKDQHGFLILVNLSRPGIVEIHT